MKTHQTIYRLTVALCLLALLVFGWLLLRTGTDGEEPHPAGDRKRVGLLPQPPTPAVPPGADVPGLGPVADFEMRRDVPVPDFDASKRVPHPDSIWPPSPPRIHKVRRVYVDSAGYVISMSNGNPAGAVRMPEQEQIHLLRHVLRDPEARITGRQVLRAESDDDLRLGLRYMGGSGEGYSITQGGVGDVYNITYPLEVSSRRWGKLRAAFILRTDGLVHDTQYSTSEERAQGLWSAAGGARSQYGAKANVLFYFPEMGREHLPKEAAEEGVREVFQTTMMLPWARSCPWPAATIDPVVGTAPLSSFFWPDKADPADARWPLVIKPYIPVDPRAGEYDTREAEHYKATYLKNGILPVLEDFPEFKAAMFGKYGPLLGGLSYPDE